MAQPCPSSASLAMSRAGFLRNSTAAATNVSTAAAPWRALEPPPEWLRLLGVQTDPGDYATRPTLPLVRCARRRREPISFAKVADGASQSHLPVALELREGHVLGDETFTAAGKAFLRRLSRSS